jgi:hypothetical protein
LFKVEERDYEREEDGVGGMRDGWWRVGAQRSPDVRGWALPVTRVATVA